MRERDREEVPDGEARYSDFERAIGQTAMSACGFDVCGFGLWVQGLRGEVRGFRSP